MGSDHSVGDALRFEPGQGGLTRAVVDTDACRGELYLHGAHVTRWRPTVAGEHDALFLSGKAVFADGQPIRGGVPVCFPWFGPHPSEPDAPSHGPVRLRAWDLHHTTREHEQVSLVLTTTEGDLHVQFACTFGPTLTMTLTATNRGQSPQPISEALHTYLTVGDVRHVHVTGLQGARYWCKVRREYFTEEAPELRITGETDRVYLDTESACTLHDPELRRRIVIDKAGSRSTVVWNIGPERVAALGDMAPDAWPHYLCIETANALDNGYVLAAGQSHTLRATLRVEPL